MPPPRRLLIRECLSIGQIDHRTGTHHSDSPAHRQDEESPDGNAKGFALGVEEAPVEC